MNASVSRLNTQSTVIAAGIPGRRDVATAGTFPSASSQRIRWFAFPIISFAYVAAVAATSLPVLAWLYPDPAVTARSYDIAWIDTIEARLADPYASLAAGTAAARIQSPPPNDAVPMQSQMNAPPVPAAAAPRNHASTPEIELLVGRGEALLGLGDIASARLYFERAADADDARAALLVGKTFDPTFLERLGARGLSGDPAKAAAWYRRARDLGASEADRHLRSLQSARAD